MYIIGKIAFLFLRIKMIVKFLLKAIIIYIVDVENEIIIIIFASLS